MVEKSLCLSNSVYTSPSRAMDLIFVWCYALPLLLWLLLSLLYLQLGFMLLICTVKRFPLGEWRQRFTDSERKYFESYIIAKISV
jgi:hypothetical protein